jgi:uncharacterized protein
MSTIDPKLLEILVCPLTKTRLTYDKVSQELISEAAGLAYPVKNGVPIMLVDEARIVNEEKAAHFRQIFHGSE